MNCKPALQLTTAALLMAALACTVGGANTAATAEAISLSLNQTATAAAVSVNPNAGLETAQAAATQLGQTLALTQEAIAAQNAVVQSATETAIAPMVNELATYGVSASAGRPGWVHPPATLDITGYLQYDYATEFASTVTQDFVVAADITWNTRTGLSGCGFALRADGNGNQYLALITRGANGHAIFSVIANNEHVQSKDYYAAPIDPANDVTNRFAVVGRGSNFTFYTNGQKAADVDANFKTGPAAGIYYEKGFVAFVGLSESGRTVCRFTNAWLWLMEN